MVLPLFSMSKGVALKQEVCLLAEMRSIAGVVTDLGAPHESLRAVNDYVLTRQAREDFERARIAARIAQVRLGVATGELP